MRLYVAFEEESIRAQQAVRDWMVFGYLTPAQRTLLEKETDPELARTSGWLRITIYFFGWICIGALIGILWIAGLLRNPTAFEFLLMSAGAYLMAEYLVWRGSQKLYRHGVEEACVHAALIFFAIGFWVLLKPHPAYGAYDASYWKFQTTVQLGVIALTCGSVYLRFGYSWVGLAGFLMLICAPAVMIDSRLQQRLLIAAMCALLAALLQPLRIRHRDDYLDQDLSVFQAALILGLYLTLNLRISSIDAIRSMEWWHLHGPVASTTGLLGFPAFFYWSTYVAVAVLPLAVLAWGIAQKDRARMNIGIITGILTLITNKPYLGWPRHEWDPMILGVFLIASAIWIRRYLAGGLNGVRHGFTARRLSASDKRILEGAAQLSFAMQAGHGVTPDVGKPQFGDGGRSGGGGAQGQF